MLERIDKAFSVPLGYFFEDDSFSRSLDLLPSEVKDLLQDRKRQDLLKMSRGLNSEHLDVVMQLIKILKKEEMRYNHVSVGTDYSGKKGKDYSLEIDKFRIENENKQAQVKVAISAPMAKEEKDFKAWIEVEYKDSYLKIRPFCFNNTSEDEVLRYKLEARKSGKSGTARTSQSGSVYIPSQEKKCLSKLGLSISPKDHYQITLEVYKDGKLVAEDSVSYS